VWLESCEYELPHCHQPRAEGPSADVGNGDSGGGLALIGPLSLSLRWA